MKKEKLQQHLSTLKGSEGSYSFGPEALVFKVMHKMFALISQKETPPRVTLKCPPADAEVLVAQYASVIPGYHMNKRHWITISLAGELPDEMLIDLANGSYELVVGQLSKADKERLQRQTR
ncbi:MAG: MmcQ/YjbR family DNA-binding protein [Candidatus Thiodiazotropha sp. (ex Epidulcina cf. delphinae)]|nr:MmcQ/YjbR family DNA-binding protein [Candidatus Thiodiazotropha sp. (ex Epidulcina cf. delphinae)]